MAHSLNQERKKAPIDIRFSFSLLTKKFYLVFTVGADRRGQNPLPVDQERREISPFWSNFIFALFIVFCLISAAVILLSILYLVKMWLDIDFLPQSSIVGDALRWLHFCH